METSEKGLAILIPIYKESKRIIEQNLEVFNGLDYPPNSQVYWLLHSKDRETRHKVMAILHFIYRYANRNIIPEVIIDEGEPPLKAKALNNAIEKTDESIIAVFDVDAIPEREFLVKGLNFLRENENTACAQGQRYMYNPKELSFLTGWQHYTYELDRQNPTSVIHGSGFLVRRKDIEEVGLFNEETVTEDYYLAMVMQANYGKKIAKFPGKYYEEATSGFWNYTRQVSRWKKGVYQANILWRKEGKQEQAIFKQTSFMDYLSKFLTLLLYPFCIWSALWFLPYSLANLLYLPVIFAIDLRNYYPYFERQIVSLRQSGKKVPKWKYFILWLIFQKALPFLFYLNTLIESKFAPLYWYHTKKSGV